MQLWQGIIVSDPKVMMGKPVIKGTRITVELIVEKLAEGVKTDELLEAYPHIKESEIKACQTYSVS